MKRCPKCNRTFPDDNQKFCTIDGGLLLAEEKPFDPNATIATSGPPKEPDLGATIATSSSAPTVVLPKDTGPTGPPTSSNLSNQQPTPQRPTPPPPPPSRFTETVALPRTPVAPPPQAPAAPPPQTPVTPPPQAPVAAAAAPAAAVPAKKKSKLPLILGVLAILLVLGIGGVVAAFFLVIKPRLDEANANQSEVVTQEQTNANPSASPAATETPTPATSEFVPPPGTTKFTNSDANLDGKLAEHYVDFSFYYPDTWLADPKAGVAGASNFAKVERRLPPDFTQENFAVGWYTSKGTYADDEPTFPQLVEALSGNLGKNFPEYQKISEGPTKVNSLDAYEFRFESISRDTEKGDIQLWGRVIFVPTGVAGEQNGATLVMLATSLAPELSGTGDVGVKGQMPVILDSFRFGKN